MDLIGAGREADVYALDEHRVLRRYRDGGDVTAEAAAMVHLAGLGFPVPRVFDAAGPDLVLERLHGPALADCDDLTVGAAARLLAGLHRRLHELPARVGACPGDRILHLDLHPENVLLTERGPVVIDWRNVTEGPADVDVALSAIILAEVAVTGSHPRAGTARDLLADFLRAAGGDPLSGLEPALAIRRTQAGENTAEAGALVASIIRS